MNLPGFAAEASLYKTSIQYGLANKWASAAEMHGVYPARRVCGSCVCDTYDFGVPGTCAKLCVDGPDQEPYPVLCDASACHPPCDEPICGKCTKTCNYPGGPSFTQACS